MARILVVDDDAALRRALSRLLQQWGHQIEVASNGLEALTTLRESRVDLLITDINMPEMDGIELLIQLSKTSTSIPIIAISGGGLLDKRLLLDSARLLATVTTFEKPVDFDTLRVTIERLLGTPAKDAGESGAV